MSTARQRSRRGFSLLEVMVALAILVVSMVILVETQSSAVIMTVEAERMITATDLANAKLTEALLLVEEEGFAPSDVYEDGDFDEFGDDVLDRELGDALEEYHWEFAISEVDLEMVGDIATMAGEVQSAMGGEEGGNEAAGSGADAMGAIGLGPEQLTEMIAPHIREVRVRVYWGDDSELAEEEGREVVIVTHVIDPAGAQTAGAELSQ